MKLGYTEFSFGYAFTENLIRSSTTRPSGAPIFPNLVQEATSGYDVRIDLPGVPLFFQYKLPELMTRDSAREISRYALPGFQADFFRMPLMRRDFSDQHRLLIQLESIFPDLVFYASPELENIDEFDSAYLVGRVNLESALFSPREIGPLPDDTQHAVSYMRGAAYGWFCSDPTKIAKLNYERLELIARHKFGEKPYSSLEMLAPTLKEGVSRVVSRQVSVSGHEILQRLRQQSIEGSDKKEPTSKIKLDLLVARELARVGLGLDLVISQPKQ